MKVNKEKRTKKGAACKSKRGQTEGESLTSRVWKSKNTGRKAHCRLSAKKRGDVTQNRETGEQKRNRGKD